VSGAKILRKTGIRASQAYKIAWAHPTPWRTWMAFAGQFKAQAPHSMQPLWLRQCAFVLSSSKTWWGQTSTQLPHPMHFSESNRSVGVPMYLNVFIHALLLEPGTDKPDKDCTPKQSALYRDEKAHFSVHTG